MATTLDYQTPSPPKDANGRAAFWGTFALSGIIGAPFGDWVLESWYHQQHPDGGGFILSCICLGVIAVTLLVVRAAAGSRVRSPVIAVACGLLGPLAGLMLLSIFVI